MTVLFTSTECACTNSDAELTPEELNDHLVLFMCHYIDVDRRYVSPIEWHEMGSFIFGIGIEEFLTGE
jgi:hypothetical protein